MEGLTKEEAIKRHREMWNYIADESEKQGRIITEKEAFEHFGWQESIICDSWCCAYCNLNCTKCPIKWPSSNNYSMCIHSTDKRDFKGLYIQLVNMAINNYNNEFAALAKRIANLPENPEA